MNRKELTKLVVNTLENAVRGRQILVLGPSGSGKTVFLEQVHDEISARFRGWVAYKAGPAAGFLSEKFFREFLEFLKKEGCLDSDFELPHRAWSLTAFFEKLSPALHKPTLRHLVFLVDDLSDANMSLQGVSTLLSSIRSFYTEWRSIDVNVHFVFVGNVNTRKLLDLYRGSDSASWPLEQGKTILYLPGLTCEEIRQWTAQRNNGYKSSLLSNLHGQYLLELSNGDVFTISRLLSGLSEQKIDCQMLFDLAERLVMETVWVDELKSRVTGLSERATQVLIKNLSGQFVCVYDPEVEEELFLSGLFQKNAFGFTSIMNTVIERGLRKNWSHIKPGDAIDIFGDISELIPPVFCLNNTAFDLIAKIEMLLRNVAVTRLGMRPRPNGKHFLRELNYEVNQQTHFKEDQYFRSNDWRQKVSRSQFVDAHAALISYSDTRDLLNLIDHLIDSDDEVVGCLKKIRPQLSGMKEIRDAVMHGQIINERSVENLYQIYRQLITELSVRA
jgi:hypothetical protein